MVTLLETMRRYACNQQGCCCSGWRISFKPSDLVRLRTHLSPAEAERLGDDEGPIDAAEAGACRFVMADGKRCEVHANHGVEALPDICVDFPVAPYPGARGVEFSFDPLCPAVLDRIVDDPAPAALVEVEEHSDEAMQRRAANVWSAPELRVGAVPISPEAFRAVRERILAHLAATTETAADLLHAIDHAYAALSDAGGSPDAFVVAARAASPKYRRFLARCEAAHGARTLERVWAHYRRFVFDIPREGPGFDELDAHLGRFAESRARWYAPSEAALQPLLVRYIAHRHASPFLTIQGRLHFAPGAVPHLLGTAVRCAAALGAVFRRPVDRSILKTALGWSEFVYRSLELEPAALPWFGITE
jgi:hypothetical protein